MRPVISAVIVSYNSAGDLRGCLASLCQHLKPRPSEILLVDNASVDGSAAVAEEFRPTCAAAGIDLRIRRNPLNVGFTRAVNQGVAMSSGKFILLLNPDTRIRAGALSAMAQFLGNHPDAGAVAPQLLFPDGRIQPSCRRFPRYRYLLSEVLGLNRLFPRSRVFNAWKMGDFDHRSLREVDQPQGACLMLPRHVLNQIGPLDERFFLFFSDVDLCQRVWQAGWKIYFFPSAQIVHRKGSTVYRDRPRLIWQSHRDFIRYFWKWYRSPLQRAINLVGIPLLALLGLLRSAGAATANWLPFGKAGGKR